MDNTDLGGRIALHDPSHLDDGQKAVYDRLIAAGFHGPIDRGSRA